MAEQATELKLIGGLFRNQSKKGDVYYSGKGEDGTQYVLFRNAYWKEGAEMGEISKSIIMAFIRKVNRGILSIYRRLMLVIEIFRASSEKSLKRVLALVRFFGKFDGH
jgi:hypothetical protein